MKVHMGAGARFVEVEVEDKNTNYSLADLEDTARALWTLTEEPRVEAMAVGFIAERPEPWGSDEPPEPNRTRRKAGLRDRRSVGAAGLARPAGLGAEPPA